MKNVKFLRFKSLNEAVLSKEEAQEFNNIITEFLKDISQDTNFQQAFFGHALSLDKNTSLIKCSKKYERKEISFPNAFDSTWELTDERTEAMINKINNFVSENVGQVSCDNSYDANIRKCGRDVTHNAHFTALSNINAHPIQRHLFTIKLPQKLDKNTAFKEGSKVLFVNYMIHAIYQLNANVDPSLEQIITSESYSDFRSWLNDLAKTNSKVKGMTNADFKKMYAYFWATDFDLAKQFINEYHTSCNMIFKLAAGAQSYVTRDESKHGTLKQFKQYVSAQLGTKLGKKAHPADLLMVGSKFDNINCAISDNPNDNTLYCAISLKEETARWGKATSAIIPLKCKYDGGQEDTFENIKKEHLYKDIDKLTSAFKDFNEYSNQEQLNTFEKFCQKYEIWLPGEKYGKTDKVHVTCKNKMYGSYVIQKIEKLNDEWPLRALSKEAIANLFITALLFSQPDEEDRKGLFAYLINSSLQLGTTPYYVAKDGQEKLIKMDSKFMMSTDNIENVTAEYTNAGDKKVTRVIVTLKFSPDDDFTMPSAKHNNQVELDVRQAGAKNTVLEFK